MKIAEKYHHECAQKQQIKDCSKVLGLITLSDYGEKLKQPQEHLQHILTTPTPTERRRFSRSPLLGFIGTIPRSLFGTMDHNDHEHLKKEIDRPYQNQRQITHLIGNNTRTIEAGINFMKKIFENNVMKIRCAEEKMKEFIKKSNELVNQISLIEYFWQLTEIVKESVYAARRYLETARKILEAVEDAKHDKLNAALINNKQIEDAAAGIEKTNPENVFPLSIPKIDTAVLAQISHVFAGHSRGKFIVIINIPLLSRDTMDLFRIIPCKTRRLVRGNRTLAAYIGPTRKSIMTTKFH
uniref:Uncharacterized protein n=1 Tax=Bracon brevicornis TaxID=1563983 RepID=A0A6V7JIM4_9HYME